MFRVAKAHDMEEWSELVNELSELGMNAEVRTLVSNPALTKQQITFTILSLLKSSKSTEAENLVKVLVDNGRVSLLPEIGTQFIALKNAAEGSADAQIVSAFDMTDAQVKDLVAVLEKRFERKLKPTVVVDNTLIGGVCVTVGDEVLDTSVRARLQQMHEALVS
ncbi:MAG: F0F1 ATP synthase subunit delta [Burkholderiaceae bacterium]|nr:F0F1 ATP synthase subunit delta [Burkholderiaceae bacterium]